MYPSYLNFKKEDLEKRIKKLFRILDYNPPTTSSRSLRERAPNCEICPRKCQVNRLKGEQGFCQLGALPMVSAYHPHFGEEGVLVLGRLLNILNFRGELLKENIKKQFLLLKKSAFNGFIVNKSAS